MNCGKYRKWLYLYRPGELSEKHRKKLGVHISRCEACEHLAAQLTELEGDLKDVRGPVASHTEPDLTRKILESVKILEKGKTRRESGSQTTRFSPDYRGSVLVPALALVLFLGFLLQESWIQLRVARLEKRIGNRIPVESYKGDSAIPESLPYHLIEKTLSYRKSLLPARGISGETVIVRKDLLLDFLSSYERLEETNRIYEKIFGILAPVLGEVKLEDGLSEKEIEFLLKNRTRIVSEISRISSS